MHDCPNGVNLKRPWEFVLSVPAQTRWLNLIREVVRKGARCAGLNDRDATDLEIAVDEACTNTILHGYGSESAEACLRICCRAAPKSFTVAIIDKAVPFNPVERFSELKSDPRSELSSRGLGLWLINRLTDEVFYGWSAEEGNRLELVKRIR